MKGLYVLLSFYFQASEIPQNDFFSLMIESGIEGKML